MATIRLENITKVFGAHTALKDLSLAVGDGEFFVLLGPTGAGKTTTLRLIAGLERPTSGSISIGGEDVREWSVAERDVALVFQYYSLYPRYTVRQNLEFPLRSKVRRHAQAEIDARVGRAAGDTAGRRGDSDADRAEIARNVAVAGAIGERIDADECRVGRIGDRSVRVEHERSVRRTIH